ncbi:MAG: hypothetical protein U0X91_27490 [Spirosomataceae bacterium]
MTNIDDPNEARRAYALRVNQTLLGHGDTLQDVLERIRQQTPPFAAQNNRPLIDFATAKEIFRFTAERLCERQGKHFVIDEENRWVLQNLVAYFIGDPTHCAFSLQKGIYLYGPVGVGKTFIFQAFRLFCQAVHQPSFTITPTRQIVREVEKAKSLAGVEKYGGGVVCFDDVGEEPGTTKLYRQEESVMGMVLAQRYENYLAQGLLTHATSNLLPCELEAQYGSRIADRCRQLFNFVPLGDDRSRSRRC